MKFNRISLEAEGFTGELTFPDARASGTIPATGGVYVVSYSGRAPVAFLPSNPGGRFKGRDPTVPDGALAANLHEAEVAYTARLTKCGGASASLLASVQVSPLAIGAFA